MTSPTVETGLKEPSYLRKQNSWRGRRLLRKKFHSFSLLQAHFCFRTNGLCIPILMGSAGRNQQDLWELSPNV